MSMKLKSVAAAIAIAAAGAAQAGVILGAAGVTTNMGQYGANPVTNLISNTGMSSSYVSGSTDFASYAASATLNAINGSSPTWFSSLGTTSGTVTFDLGSVQNVDAMALWGGHAFQSNTLKNFSLFDDSNTLLGSFQAMKGPQAAGQEYGVINAQVFSFAATSTQYIRMEIADNWGGSFATASEVVFEQAQPAAAVPIPAPLALLAIGGAALALQRRRFSLPA